MVDLHSHILPDIDDGPKSINETLNMGKIAETEGFKKIIATPHYMDKEFTLDKKEVLNSIYMVNNLFLEKAINIEVLPGMEVYISPDLPSKLKGGEILTLNNTLYVLIEFPMGNIPIYTEEILYQVRLLGYRPIIAHPERYTRVIDDPGYLNRLIEQGNYVQVNSLSLVGGAGKKVKKTAEILLKHKMVHFIGTDAHSSGNRSPKIKEALIQIERWVGKEYASEIINNGRTLIEGGEVLIGKPLIYRPAKGICHRIGKLFTWKEKGAYG